MAAGSDHKEIVAQAYRGVRDHAEHTERTYAAIGELFASKGEKFDDADAENLTTGAPPSEPDFPFLILGLAITKSFLDALDFTLVGAVLVYVFSLTTGIILAIWSMNKLSGGWWKKAMIRWIWTRLGICIVIEMIPFARVFIPADAIFVLMAHYKETKLVRLFNGALEILHDSGVGHGPRFRARPGSARRPTRAANDNEPSQGSRRAA